MPADRAAHHGAIRPAVKVGLACVPPLWFATQRTALGAACLFAFLALTGQ